MKKTKITGKIPEKTAKKRKKNKKTEALQVFMLLGAIIGVTIIISCAVIITRVNPMQNAQSFLTDNDNDFRFIEKIDDNIAAEPAKNYETIKNETTGNHLRDDSITLINALPASTTVPQENQAVNAHPGAVTNNGNETRIENKVPSVKPSYQGTLAFVIDDAGNNLRELDPFLNIQWPLTIAVLPGLPYSAEAARRIRAAGKEVILHQPMEALGAQNPGPGAIYSNMSAGEIREILSRNIAEVGPVAGVNNHQGSKITMDIHAMETILSFCAENNIYFLDSRTTAETAAPAAAQKLGMKIAERNIFIDNEQSRESMLSYISSGLTRAKNSGTAVMIGHTWSPELAPLLARQLPVFIEQGYAIRSVSDILK